MNLPLLLFAPLAGLMCAALCCEAQPGPGAPKSSPAPQGPPEGTKVVREIRYVEPAHPRQKLDLYLPAAGGKPSPVIIWIHGGAWKGGSKDRPPAIRFLSKGYAVASLEYRMSQDATFPAQIEDCKAAVRWLRAHAQEHNLDPNRFGAWGASAGGHLAALLDTTGDIKSFDVGPNTGFSSKVQAVVDFFGPSDLAKMGAQSGPESRMDHNAADSPESQLIGGAVQENKAAAAKASPVTYVSSHSAPILIVHGDADPLVPHQQSETFYQALKQAGVDATLHIVKGGGHGNGFGPEVNKLVEAFFDKHLKADKNDAG
jgi:acetyl esterase/lipase